MQRTEQRSRYEEPFRIAVNRTGDSILNAQGTTGNGFGSSNGTEDSCSCATDRGAVAGSDTYCNNGIDNDCDGNTDCSDSGCTADPVCNFCIPTYSKEKGPRCSDGIDNDCEGAADGADTDC
ncbi:MAG: hypothetical protein GWM89_08025 [Candidatus Dadabacteria bacterium]|nr:hypothetical protein [Candidatus Dadabacteria bacterium]NIY22358.1 hypothetical protein [Candidatus Dadabacteria bacterium]